MGARRLPKLGFSEEKRQRRDAEVAERKDWEEEQKHGWRVEEHPRRIE
jgi:hypothetical protein